MSKYIPVITNCICFALIAGSIAVYISRSVEKNDNSLVSEIQPNNSWANLELQEFEKNKANNKKLGKTYYVDINKGNDSYSGTTEKLAFKTIQQANEKVAPGDIVYVKNGKYEENIKITASGKPKNWIVFQAFLGHKPFVAQDNQDGTFRIEGNYIKIIGFKISSTDLGSGIYSRGNHHIQIINNEIHDSGCGGISGQETDYLYIEGNISYRNAFRAPYQCSGISIYQAKAFDQKPGFHNIVRGNISYSNENKVPRNDGKITDGNGIIIDDFRQTQGSKKLPRYTAWTLVENNIVFDNGGRGIHIFQSDNVIVRNNTSFKNLKTKQLDGNSNGELSAIFSSYISFYNNIAYARSNLDKTFVDDYSNGNIWDYNLSYNGSISLKNSHSNTVVGSHNLIDTNPLFINPSIIYKTANFSLQAKSPAINSGTSINVASIDFENRKRPSGSEYDMGAYEFNSLINKKR